MKDVVLQAKSLTKKYGNFTALDHVDMTVYKGEIYGLIGCNGAGKTTMMKILSGLTESSEGEFSIFGTTGSNAEKEKKRIGCLIENPAFFGNLTAYQNLRYYCCLKGITNYNSIDEALTLVGLNDARNKKFRKFSLGMKQRLGIAFALLDYPDLIILDEPINGLDPLGISQLRETFRRLSDERNITIIISSHILSELYSLATNFLFIDKGKILKEVTKQELDLECRRCLVIKTEDIKKTAAILEQKLDITDYKVTDTHELRIYSDSVKSDVINSVLLKNDVSVSGIFESGLSLEDYFKQLIREVQL